MAEPWVIITGATGFLGGQLVRHLRKEYRVFALDRRTPKETGAPEGAGIEWFQVDLGRLDQLREVFSRIRDKGGAQLLLHLAAYYDFSGEDSPEYTRTNVEGTRNVLELAEPLRLRRFIFASSIAACPFPPAGATVTEETEPTTTFPYGSSKQRGEALIREYRERVPSCIIRPAAIFSDWCEYEPLDVFLRAWCSNGWNARILGGRGLSAVPYLHVEDLLSFLVRVVEHGDDLRPAEVLQASPDGCTSHLELFREATRCWFGAPRRPVFMPVPLARPGIRARELLGQLTGRMPFERSWMADYIDQQLNVDMARTRRRIDWAADPDHGVLRRLPLLIENMRKQPQEWRRVNALRRKVRIP
ncbi:MAG TPA: NAD(P)-dependent oxidoreductase [bacterium]